MKAEAKVGARDAAVEVVAMVLGPSERQSERRVLWLLRALWAP